jgi:hypothetical protein
MVLAGHEGMAGKITGGLARHLPRCLAGQPGGVVEVAMAADDRLDADRILA